MGASLGGLAVLTSEAKASAAALVFVDVVPRLETRGVRQILEFMSSTSARGFETCRRRSMPTPEHADGEPPRRGRDRRVGLEWSR